VIARCQLTQGSNLRGDFLDALASLDFKL